MPVPQSHLRPVVSDLAVGLDSSFVGSAPQRLPQPVALSRLGAATALLTFVAWLALFAGGILVDTEPYRTAISPEGAAALAAEGRRLAAAPAPDAATATPAPAPDAATATPASARLAPARTVPPTLRMSWLVVLTCFLPLNLAWLCITSSALGAFGSRVNLSDDLGAFASRDTSSPYISAMLRGFFVYLFMMSGVMLLDDAPFSNAGPSQYLRLAGFLSLFSFVISYQPRLFTTLIASALQRIQVRGGGDASLHAGPNAETVRATVDVELEKRSTP